MVYILPRSYKYLLCLSGGAFGRFIQVRLGELDLWQGPHGKVKMSLRSCRDMCERWAQTCETLTTQFWRRYTPHPWKGDKVVQENVLQLGKRLAEVCVFTYLFI